MNKLIMTGRLTTDPTEVKDTGAVKFPLAVNYHYITKHGEYKDETTFIDVVVFGGLAKAVLDKLSKGDRVAVSGRIHQSGKYRYDLPADEVEFLEIRNKKESTKEKNGTEQ